MELNRRQFMQVAGTATAIASTSVLSSSFAFADETIASTQVAFDEEIDCDIAIVGAGASGLAAAVEAGDSGLVTVVIENAPDTGGNIIGVEGCFGIGSSMQKELGIEVDPGALIRSELEQAQYRIGGCNYTDMVHASGDNVDWLQEHGVLFGGVDTDLGTERVFHRFETGNGALSYVPQMTEAAQNAGVQFIFETHADALVQDESGTVCGVYATKKDGTTIKVNSKAVVVATGSYMSNEQYMLELGCPVDKIDYLGRAGYDGAGHDMCIAAGARSNRGNSSPLGAVKVAGLPTKFQGGKFFYVGFNTPDSMWVNQNGERFTNEEFAKDNFCLMVNPAVINEETYVLMDAPKMEAFIGGDEAAQSIDAAKAALDAASDDGVAAGWQELADGIELGEIFKGETLAELAEQAGMDPNTLITSVERYNESCAAGSDRDFGKAPELLLPIEEGPFYLVHLTIEILCVTGSVKTDRNFSAVDLYGKAIPGLYVVGIEGAMLWANVYTINISGACNANSVNSGRTAVRHAIQTCL